MYGKLKFFHMANFSPLSWILGIVTNMRSALDDHLLIMKKTNKQTWVVEHMIINYWLSDDLMIIYLIIWWSCDNHLLIIWWPFDEYLLNYLKEKKQTNCWFSSNLLIIYCSDYLCFVDHLLIIWWSYIDYLNRNKQRNKQR